MPDQDPETFFDSTTEEPEQDNSEVVEEEVEEQSPEGEGSEEEFAFLKGTTFKKPEDLLKAYNELRGEFTRRNQETSELKGLLKQVLPFLTRTQQQEVKENPEDFMKAFVTDPKGTLLSLITETSQSVIEPIKGEVGGVKASLELEKFLSKHPELQESDVEAFMKVMDSYPEVKGRKDRLEVWLKLLKHENPEIGQRTTAQKASMEQGVSDAKKAAVLGGKKSSIPRKEGGDEFDEVLKLWSERNAKFR
jgi:hypothetical protein